MRWRHNRIVGVVLFLEPLVPDFTARLDAQLDVLLDVNAPLALDEAGLLGVESPSDLDCLADLSLRGQSLREVVRPLEGVLVGLVNRGFAHFRRNQPTSFFGSGLR